jgi:hypothetical protein
MRSGGPLVVSFRLIPLFAMASDASALRVGAGSVESGYAMQQRGDALGSRMYETPRSARSGWVESYECLLGAERAVFVRLRGWAALV